MTKKAPGTLILLLCLALLAAGCGGEDSDTSTATTATTGAADRDAGAKGPQDGSTAKQGGGGSGGGQTSRHAIPEPVRPAPTEKEVRAFRAPPGGDDSIQTYGSVAEDEEEEAVATAMRSFFVALAARDYRAVCAGLTKGNRQQFLLLLKAKKEGGSCASLLKGLLVPQAAPEARKAARGVVYQVRIDDDTAFVLFTPAGGKASYFVMKREGDGWRSTSLSTGAPFDPTS